MKTCPQCKQTKSAQEFSKNCRSIDGLNRTCRECHNRESRNKYYIQEYGSVAEGEKQINLKKLKLASEKSSASKTCRVCKKTKTKNSFLPRKDGADGYRKICLKCHHQQQSVREKKWRQNNPDRRLSKNIAVRMWYSLRGKKDYKHWEYLVGYSFSDLKQHLESRFLPGMSWDNYGDWHVDHIRPVASFSISSYRCDEFKNCWSLSNLQPLWASDNKSKYAKWSPTQTDPT